MTQIEHVCAICCRREIDDYVISGWNFKTVECYIAVNFEVISSSCFRDIRKHHFVTSAVARRTGTSSIALGENAFAFCFKTVLSSNQLSRDHDPQCSPKWTRLCDFLLTWSNWWRHFLSGCWDFQGQPRCEFFEFASFTSFRQNRNQSFT